MRSNRRLGLLAKQAQLRQAGIDKLIAGTGFRFGKTLERNFSLLRELGRFTTLGIPLLAGISRKSMINRVLAIKAENALNGTTFFHAFFLQNGANILRVHDVKEAVEAVLLWECYEIRD